MIKFDEIIKNEKLFLAMTSLKPYEFKILLPIFKKNYDNYEANFIERQETRERGHGGGRKPALRTYEDKLLFIIFYFKLYPLQILIGFLFGMGQSQANEWIHKLTKILKMTLEEMRVLPERNPEKLEKNLAESRGKDFSIDGTDRPIQRPKDKDKQKTHYSGKKKRHTVKNNLIVNVEEREVKYMSGTYEGKKHDKKICDEEELVFPKGINMFQDNGFQGYNPEGVNVIQPTKKPRGKNLSIEEKVQNAVISGVRVVVEHVIAGVKRCRIVKDVFRNTKEKYDDIVMEIACGLHNFRTQCRLNME